MNTYLNNEKFAAQKAQELRDRLGLGTAPIADMTVLFESLGVDLAVIDTEDEDAHGMTAKDPSSMSVFTVVPTSKNPMRQRSSIAHELGHIILDEWHEGGENDYATRDGAEVRADIFARHLLIPEAGVRQFAGQKEAPEFRLVDFSRLVQTYQVSPYMAAIAAANAGVIGEDTKEDFKQYSTFSLAQQFGWADQYRAMQETSSQKRAPQRLLQRVIRAYQQGVISLQAVATLRQVPLEQVQAEFDEAGIFPQPLPDFEFTDFDLLNPIDSDELDRLLGGSDD